MPLATLYEHTPTVPSEIHEQLMGYDRLAAEVAGMHPEDVAKLNHIAHAMSGEIQVPDTDEVANADRYHVGPDDLIAAGGMKYKYYTVRVAAGTDGIVHGWGMRVKAGVLGRTGYKGGKSIVNYDSRSHSDQQNKAVMRLNAHLMHAAGLTNPWKDKPAGDEGTNMLIAEYVAELEAMGVPNAFATITGKPDMVARPAATGEGAAIVQRTRMAHLGRLLSRSAVQGAGFAGAYYAAEAYDPRDERDREWAIPVAALGDLDLAGSKATLFTDHQDGLPITREMVDGILLDPTDQDLTHEKVQGNKLYAFARKLERVGCDLQIAQQDVLTFREADLLVPAATSHVITRENIGSIVIRRWMPIANNATAEDAQAAKAELDIEEDPCELVSAGGVDMSFVERERDLARIAAEKEGLSFQPESPDVYRAKVREHLVTATRRVSAVAERYKISLVDATRAVSLGNYAIARGMQLDPTFRDILLANA